MTRSVYPWLSTKRSCEAWEVSKVWKESYGQISTVQPSGTQIWTSSPRSWTLSPALCQKHFGRSKMSNSDRSAKSNSIKQLLSVLSANESFSMFQLTNQGCFSQHPGFLPSEDAISMPPPVSEALLPQYLWLPGTRANPGCGGRGKGCRFSNEWKRWHLGKSQKNPYK